MFHRNPFTKSPPAGEDSLHPTIPEDEQVPSTPIPERPTLFTSDSWQDPNFNEPKSASWTSQAAAYDINPKYTTANQSYTHRRRKSSVITNLIAGSNDPYQPTYQDWREGVASPESLRPRSKSWSFWGRRKSFGRKKNGCGKAMKLVVVVFVLVTVVLSGLWLFGGPMPLVTVDDLRAVDWSAKFNASGVQWEKWEKWKIDLEVLETVRPKQVHERWAGVKRWFGDAVRRDDHHAGVSSAVAVVADQTSSSGGAISIAVNSDLLQSFGAGTMQKVTRKASSTAVSASITHSATSTKKSSAVVGESVGTGQASSNKSTESSSAIYTNTEDDFEMEASRKRSQAMWKKYAQPEDGTIPFVATLADEISPPTEMASS